LILHGCDGEVPVKGITNNFREGPTCRGGLVLGPRVHPRNGMLEERYCQTSLICVGVNL
jgi:hypothetical protein